MFHRTYINLEYYVIDYHVQIRNFQTYLIYCCFCISDTVYLRYILGGSGRHKASDYYCRSFFEYKYNISCISCNNSILV